jgi:hypothetical protein
VHASSVRQTRAISERFVALILLDEFYHQDVLPSMVFTKVMFARLSGLLLPVFRSESHVAIKPSV